MKLNIEKFEELAIIEDCKNGCKLFYKLGGTSKVYGLLKKGLRIGYEIVKEIFNNYGEWVTNNVIIWEGESIESFKSKYVLIQNILY